jgi:hypothetical protein
MWTDINQQVIFLLLHFPVHHALQGKQFWNDQYTFFCFRGVLCVCVCVTGIKPRALCM